MINPNTIINTVVDLLRDTPEVLRHFNNDPTRITPYRDNPPLQMSLSRYIYLAPTPSLVVGYMGTTPGENYQIGHALSFYIRARDSDDPKESSYASVISEIFNARPTSLQGVKLFNEDLKPGPFTLAVPIAQRIHDDQGLIDIFELITKAEENLDNYGEIDA